MTNQEGLECPKEIKIDDSTKTDKYMRFVAEPWEKGYGVTVGNALRRVLMSSMEGIAVTSIMIENIPHEFTSIPDVMEDVMEIVLNIKKLRFNSTGHLPCKLELKADTAGAVTGADIRATNGVEVVNPEQHICTLNKSREFRIEMEVDRGRKYRTAEENKHPDQPIGTIPVDSLFSSIERVRFDVKDCRVGQHTDYDRLEMEIWTDGRILPEEALSKSANMLKGLFSVFINEEADSKNIQAPPSVGLNEEEKALLETLKKEVSYLELSVRAVNCLSSANIKYIGELVEKSENQMLKFKNFGRKSLLEIKDKLKEMSLGLEMNLPEPVKDELNRLLSAKTEVKED